MNYFTTHQTFYLVPPNMYDGEFRKITFYLELLDKSGIAPIIKEATSTADPRGRLPYNPYHLFSAILYCFALNRGTLREMEESMEFDTRLLYLMDQQSPSFKTIGDYINDVIIPNQYELFTRITDTIIQTFNLDISDQYLDGTKLEANANKYKFVWKPTKFHKNLDIKIRDYFKRIDFEYSKNGLVKSTELFTAVQKYEERTGIITNEIPSGKGKKLTKEQRLCREGFRYLLKLLEYEEKESICGENRKSYYKSDHDATAMALKTDYYSGHGSNMHAAYNVQILVSSGIITMYGVFQDRADYYTLTPMLDKYEKYYKKYPINLCADSGYGIYVNYKYIEEKGIGNYIKFQSWNGETSGNRPQIFFIDEDLNVKCINKQEGKKSEFTVSRHQKYKDGVLYSFSNCQECGYAYICKKNLKNKDTDDRYIELIPAYERYKEKARNNLLSRKGIEIRVNRSIQVEGTFGQIKQDMKYVRIRRRGMNKVRAEIMLVSLGKNIRKIFSMLSKETVSSKYWELTDDIKDESMPVPKSKKN